MANTNKVRVSRRVLIAVSLAAALASSMRGQIMPILPDANTGKADLSIKVPEYEVATVKVHKGDDRNMRIGTHDDSFSASNLPLTTLMAFAYDSRPDLISGGPGWVGSARFDVEAKLSGADVEVMKKLSSEQRRTMMRKVLEEHFNLKIHTETKNLPVYELVVAKDGVKMQTDAVPVSASDSKTEEAKLPRGSIRSSPGMVEGHGLPMNSVTAQLAFILQHSVIDKTGLPGRYTFTLKWTSEQAQASRADNGADENGPSIFTAVQEQLGLKLQPAKGPVETLVIDHADMPSEN